MLFVSFKHYPLILDRDFLANTFHPVSYTNIFYIKFGVGAYTLIRLDLDSWISGCLVLGCVAAIASKLTSFLDRCRGQHYSWPPDLFILVPIH